MKKLLFILAAFSGVAYGACFGPFCYDDTGISIGGTLQDGNGSGMPNMTQAQISAACPKAKGQEVYCSDCKAAGAGGTVCVSTATTCGVASPFDYVLSTGTKCS